MTIQTFVGLMGHDSLRVFDVNLRQNFYSLEVIEISLGLANVFKLDVNELSVVKKLLGFKKVAQLHCIGRETMKLLEYSLLHGFIVRSLFPR